MNKFRINALIVSAVFIVEMLLKLGQGMMGFAICFVNLGIVIFMYKNYADSETEKPKLKVSRGAIFGLHIAIVTVIFSFLYFFVIMDVESIRQMMISGAEKSASFMGEEELEKAMEMYDNMSGTSLRLMFGGFSMLGSVFTIVYGLIAGAIFKYKEDEA